MKLEELVGYPHAFRERDRPVLTVQMSSKWYELYVVYPGVRPEGFVAFIDFGQLEEFVKDSNKSAYVDHVPNPWAVARLATARGYEVENIAMELIVGRWELEVKHRYNDLFRE